jgi:hypothetical protein
MSFVPKGYSVPSSGGSDYLTLEEGANKIRIMSPEPIMGFEYWTPNPEDSSKRVPVRVRKFSEVPEEYRNNINPREKAKHFWSLVVWNYKLGKLQVMTITQKSIQSGILAFAQNEDWGNPNDYDVTIVRSVEGEMTKYQVIPSPKKAASNEARVAYEMARPKLEKIYDNGHPLRNDENESKSAKKEEEVEDVDISELDSILD